MAQFFDNFSTGAVLVIGGSGGLGVDICRAFANLGSNVAFTFHRNAAAADTLAKELNNASIQAERYQLTLTDTDNIAKVFAETEKKFGSIHTVVFASGGKVQLAPVAEMPREQWESCVATDVFGFFNIIQAALPYLRKTQGSIVALSTAATQTYAPLDILSAGPKGSLEQLVKAVGREEGKNGVRANGVRVGHIDAGQGIEIQDDPRGKRLAERVVAGTPLRRLGTADDISNAVIYFASSMASYVTGEFIAVDGGGHI